MAWVEEEDMSVRHVVVSFSLASQVTVPLTNARDAYVTVTNCGMYRHGSKNAIYLHPERKKKKSEEADSRSRRR